MAKRRKLQPGNVKDDGDARTEHGAHDRWFLHQHDLAESKREIFPQEGLRRCFSTLERTSHEWPVQPIASLRYELELVAALSADRKATFLASALMDGRPKRPAILPFTALAAACCYVGCGGGAGNTVADAAVTAGGATALGGTAGGDGGVTSAGGSRGGPSTGGVVSSGGKASGGAGGVLGQGGASGSDAASVGGRDAAGAGDTGDTGDADGRDGAVSAGGSSGGNDASAADPCGPQNPARVPLPVIGPGTFDVKTYGATGDGKTDDTKALQAALAAAGSAGGGTVTVPAGIYLSGPIVLSSGTRLDLAKGATLKMLPMATYGAATAFITANNAHDLALTGSGTIDGQGQDWWTAFASDATLVRPQEVVLNSSARVLISGLRFQNSPAPHIWVKDDTDVTITGITISTLAVAGQAPPKNTDGIDIGATGLFFCNNTIATGDDNIVMGGSNIYVGYSTFRDGHGCSIGSVTKNGGVRNVTVDHLTMNGTDAGIRMKSARDRGGLVKNLSYSNITMTNVKNPIFITSYYPTMPMDPTADTAQPITATTPLWQNITIKNLTATGSTNGGLLWGLPEAKIATVVFDNVNIAATKGMRVFHATGISFVNGSTVKPTSGAAVTTYDADVTGIATTPY